MLDSMGIRAGELQGHIFEGRLVMLSTTLEARKYEGISDASMFSFHVQAYIVPKISGIDKCDK
jgi:hypothetical protein